MEFQILYWHWVVLGLMLMLSEIIVTTFFILWFGLAAVIMGIVIFFAPNLSLALQLFMWTLLSCAMAFFWFKYLKPLSIDKTKAGLSREAIIGQVGQVVDVPQENMKGNINDGINAFVAKQEADLLCMIRRKRSFVENLFHVSVTEKEIFDSPVPLLVLPEPELA